MPKVKRRTRRRIGYVEVAGRHRQGQQQRAKPSSECKQKAREREERKIREERREVGSSDIIVRAWTRVCDGVGPLL